MDITGYLSVELDPDEADLIAGFTTSDTSLRHHLATGRTVLDGTTLHAHPHWMAYPVQEHLIMLSRLGTHDEAAVARRAYDKLAAVLG